MVALLPRGLWSLTVTPFLPCQHRLAYMDTSVIDDIRLDYIIATGLYYSCKSLTEKVVPHMTQMQRLVCVW